MSQRLQHLSAFDRHKRLMQEYVSYYGGEVPSAEQHTLKTDYDALKESYRFIRNEEDDRGGDVWEIQLAHKYYSKLFKEYAIIDLSLYKEGKYGMRWRTNQEVVASKGQFICGAKSCDRMESLESFEVPFGYREDGQQKVALVKVRLCQQHALQLTYRKDKDALKAQRKAKRKAADAMDLTEKHFDTGRSKSKLSTEKSLITEEKAESGHGEPPSRATYRPPIPHTTKSTVGGKDSNASQTNADRNHQAEADNILAQLLL